MSSVSQPTTLFSLPGEWIDRRGRPRPRLPLRRILVIKPDHIGDMLVADDAFALLRQFFPEAKLELICGTWNVGLARRLDLFDAVYGLDLFHPLSSEQSNDAVADQWRQRGAEALAALGLGPFDLAIDLRYEADTRHFLQHVDAVVYAGFGRTSDFPFLDVVIPRDEIATPKGGSEVMLFGQEFSRHDLGPPGGDPVGRSGGEFCAREILLGFEIEGAVSPKACGVSADDRVLGVGLEEVTLHGLAGPNAELEEHEPPRAVDPVFHYGWHAPEAWGTWSRERRACVALRFPKELTTPFARIDLGMRGQVNPGNEEVTCTIRGGSDGQPVVARFTHPSTKWATASVVVATRAPRISLASKSFELLPGRYEGHLRLYVPRAPPAAAHIELTIRGLTGKAALLRHAFHIGAGALGIVGLPFACTLESANERLRIELVCDDPELLDGVRVESFSLKAVEQFKPRFPGAHMGDWASLLVLRVAQIFSDQPPFRPGAQHRSRRRSLAERIPGAHLPEPLGTALDRLQRWRDAGSAVIGAALGCNTAIRKWPLLYYVELGRQLLHLGRVELVFLGALADAPEALEACMALGLDPLEHSICGKIELEHLGLVLGKLDLFVGNDTGITHFAAKAGTRTICIKAGTSHPREWGPIGENASWIYRDVPCAPCALHEVAKCKHWLACMRDILPEDVLALAVPEVQAVLSQRRSSIEMLACPGLVRSPTVTEPRYVIHIGPPKTGSKYLQSHLFHSRSTLAEAGICYPENWWTKPNEIFHLPILKKLRGDRAAADLGRSFAEINTAGHRAVVLSCEGFDALTEEELQPLREAIGEHPIEIVYYCRRWSDRIPSDWRQHLQMGQFITLPEFYTRYRNPTDSAEVNYSRAWDTYARVFGRNSLRLVSYSNLRDCGVDLVQHFLKTFLDWDKPVKIPPGLVQANISPDMFDTEILRVLNYLDFQACGRIRPNMRVKLKGLRQQVDTALVTELMAEDVGTFEILDGSEVFHRSYEAISAYADCLVSKELGESIFTRRGNGFRYIRGNYLMRSGAMRELEAIYRQLDETPFVHADLS